MSKFDRVLICVLLFLFGFVCMGWYNCAHASSCGDTIVIIPGDVYGGETITWHGDVVGPYFDNGSGYETFRIDACREGGDEIFIDGFEPLIFSDVGWAVEYDFQAYRGIIGDMFCGKWERETRTGREVIINCNPRNP